MAHRRSSSVTFASSISSAIRARLPPCRAGHDVLGVRAAAHQRTAGPASYEKVACDSIRPPRSTLTSTGTAQVSSASTSVVPSATVPGSGRAPAACRAQCRTAAAAPPAASPRPLERRQDRLHPILSVVCRPTAAPPRPLRTMEQGVGGGEHAVARAHFLAILPLPAAGRPALHAVEPRPVAIPVVFDAGDGGWRSAATGRRCLHGRPGAVDHDHRRLPVAGRIATAAIGDISGRTDRCRSAAATRLAARGERDVRGECVPACLHLAGHTLTARARPPNVSNDGTVSVIAAATRNRHRSPLHVRHLYLPGAGTRARPTPGSQDVSFTEDAVDDLSVPRRALPCDPVRC